ncbi:Kynurenine formamidase [Yamadazyma tenuis]|uniref:Kynurenine formamidase n=1 Tax=Candida tenuis (strain ATCC 10573 / BCRC 21748 / CBS 615 / JCM 9827 / NBRC 10315 / NRRL Y-1498 / VKM Y-70) TaxID=590646 RepID=G3B7U8_CANTC|nr:alpha/beta-hydrolase [Yamadazyma tenuis ATCC 10573]XP_006688772.1 uncharacterized protein CANTEDRAFT_115121 [Yamadazyma tenuis ATCC 10573]EGV62601.1 alpha/beta-hydrolase [Yamadazyma tenuis ATCC 10573]EGV62602.1 hypothetical protein CANTEDRAFT_115121 [Yamadazyma tenuis ATCC 10573]WEJ92889.1 Kynurenine formamidase [Yamadazyma tenuis]
MVEVYSYGPHELQSVKVFQQDPSTKDAIVFIHGGGWRDPSNSFDDFKPIMKDFSKCSLNVISINYRLSPSANTEAELKKMPYFRHPFHLLDVLKALVFLVKDRGLNIISVVGHSVGATLCLQLMNYKEVLEYGFKYIPANNKMLPTKQELDEIDTTLADSHFRRIYLIDGIFDVENLVQEYGDSYRTFVRCAFDSDDHFKDAVQTSNHQLGAPHLFIQDTTKVFLIHSLEDELLSPRQTKLLATYLTSVNINHEVVLQPWGLHEEVYRRSEVSAFIIKNLF